MSQRPRRTRSTTLGPSPSSVTLRTYSTASPADASVWAVPAVASSRKPSPASACATGTTPPLSSSRTERNAVPLAGSLRPAARSALANAVGRSEALAITPPVARTSGPGPREGGKRQPPPLHENLAGVGRRELGVGEGPPRREPARGLDEVDADRLA